MSDLVLGPPGASKFVVPEKPEAKKRFNYIGAPQMFELNQACLPLIYAYGQHLYLVGSCLDRRDYRDVDVRCILPNEKFDEMFPGIGSNHQLDARWSLMCSALSLWLQKHSGLPIDFQFQRNMEANRDNKGMRIALGLFITERKDKPRGDG